MTLHSCIAPRVEGSCDHESTEEVRGAWILASENIRESDEILPERLSRRFTNAQTSHLESRCHHTGMW